MKAGKLTVQELSLPGVLLITPTLHRDARGFFVETYNQEFFLKLGIEKEFVQDAVSFSKKNILRGLHYQKPPYGQAKLVRCVQGTIFDVVADIAPDSVTFGQHISLRLSGEEQAMLYIPEGYAHGFCVLSETATVSYKLSVLHHPVAETGIRYDDPTLAIDWPCMHPVLSEKDNGLRTL